MFRNDYSIKTDNFSLSKKIIRLVLFSPNLAYSTQDETSYTKVLLTAILTSLKI